MFIISLGGFLVLFLYFLAIRPNHLIDGRVKARAFSFVLM